MFKFSIQEVNEDLFGKSSFLIVSFLIVSVEYSLGKK